MTADRAAQIARLRRAADYLAAQTDTHIFSLTRVSLTALADLMTFRPGYTPPDLETQLYTADTIEQYVAFARSMGAAPDGVRRQSSPRTSSEGTDASSA